MYLGRACSLLIHLGGDFADSGAFIEAHYLQFLLVSAGHSIGHDSAASLCDMAFVIVGPLSNHLN